MPMSMEDDFLSWPRQRQRAELDHIQRLLDDTRNRLNLYDGEYRDSYDVDHSLPHTPEPILASTPHPSSERFTVRPQGPESFFTSRVGDPQVNTLVTQTTSVFSFTRPIAVTSAVSQTQRQVSFAPPPRDARIQELYPMEQTSIMVGSLFQVSLNSPVCLKFQLLEIFFIFGWIQVVWWARRGRISFCKRMRLFHRQNFRYIMMIFMVYEHSSFWARHGWDIQFTTLLSWNLRAIHRLW